jgi:FtsZ-binding cell division protein ZapB
MTNIGDLVPKAGIYTNPGVVTEKKADGTVVIDTEPLTINKFHRYANTTGLDEQEKMTFNAILDDIYKKENDVEKINDIQMSIDKLKVEPQNQKIVQYLRNQQAHLIRKAKQLPRMYNTDTSNLRGHKAET